MTAVLCHPNSAPGVSDNEEYAGSALCFDTFHTRCAVHTEPARPKIICAIISPIYALRMLFESFLFVSQRKQYFAAAGAQFRAFLGHATQKMGEPQNLTGGARCRSHPVIVSEPCGDSGVPKGSICGHAVLNV